MKSWTRKVLGGCLVRFGAVLLYAICLTPLLSIGEPDPQETERAQSLNRILSEMTILHLNSVSVEGRDARLRQVRRLIQGFKTQFGEPTDRDFELVDPRFKPVAGAKGIREQSRNSSLAGLYAAWRPYGIVVEMPGLEIVKTGLNLPEGNESIRDWLARTNTEVRVRSGFGTDLGGCPPRLAARKFLITIH